MKRSTIGFICFGIFLIIISILPIGYGAFAGMGIAYGNPQNLPFALLFIGVGMTPLIIGIVIIIWQVRANRRWTRVIGAAAAHKRITIDKVSEQSGVGQKSVRSILYDGIKGGYLRGRVEENTFIRTEVTPTVRVGAKEVMVTRRAPEACYKCGAKLSPQEVKWLGPDTIECPYCGSTMAVETERL